MCTQTTTKAPGLADLFVELADEELTECIAYDLASASPRELASQFRQACDVLEGLCSMAESLEMGTFMVLCEARRRANEARRRCEEAAGLPVSNW